MTKEESQSIWQKTDGGVPFLPALSSHQTADVCVIGAGIAGLTVAYELLREGRSVVVLERGSIGEGQTGLTSAHLSNVLDEGYVALNRMHGASGARLAARSHAEAINEIERIVKRENIDCAFQRVQGYLFLGSEQKMTALEAELQASREAGLEGVKIRAIAEPFYAGPALAYPNQAEFHPIRYVLGLAAAVKKLGGKIFPHTEAMEVEGGRPARVTTQRGFQVVSGAVVVAANVPFNDRITMHTKMAPYRSYVVGLKIAGEARRHALYWDTETPYHYLRFVNDDDGGQILLVGGGDHRVGQGQDEETHYAELQSWAESKLGAPTKLVYRWSGQILEPHDGLAFIGRNPGDEDNVYITTGDSGHGLTHGTIAGMLIRDLILGRENEWANLYEPARVNLRSLNTYFKEVVSSTAPYGDWVTPGDVGSIQDITPGEGAVVRVGVQKLAVYRDSFGRAHMCSAVCPHLNGIVRWNTAEKTWDCPCHGSRFDRTGKVINGPAATGLKEVADPTVYEGESASA